MTRKSKTYDSSSIESFGRKTVDMGNIQFNGNDQIDPVFTIENASLGGALALSFPNSTSVNGSENYINFLYNNGASLGSLRSFSSGPSSSGMQLFLGGEKDFSIDAEEVIINSGGNTDEAKFRLNETSSSDQDITAIIKSPTSSIGLLVNKTLETQDQTWLKMTTENVTGNEITFSNNSSGDILARFEPYASREIEFDLMGSTTFDVGGDLTLDCSDNLTMEIGGRSLINLQDGVSIIKNSADTSVPVIRSVRSSHGFFLECGTSDSTSSRLGGIRYRSLGDYDADGSFTYAFSSYRDSTATLYSEGETTSGLQFTSAAADFAEYFDIDRSYDWGTNKNNDLHKEIIIPEGYVVYVKDNVIHKDPVGTPMVTSQNPLIAGNNKGSLSNMLSFSGQLGVFVEGKVESGDLLIPKGNVCVAIKKDKITMSQYIDAIGRAAESSDEEGLKKVNCLIGIK